MAKVLLAEGAAPSTPASGYLALYATTGGAAAFVNDAGTAGTLASHVSATSWTPALQFGGAAVGMTFTTQIGRYARVGNVVVFHASLVLSAKGSSTGTATITGLPFNMASGTGLYATFPFFGFSLASITAGNQLLAAIASGNSTINLYNNAPTATVSVLSDANFGATSTIHATGVYITSGY